MKPNSRKIAGCILILIILWAIAFSCREDEFVPLKINSVSPKEALIGDTIAISGEGFSPDYSSNLVYFSNVEKYVNPVKGSTTAKLMIAVPDSAQTGTIRVNILNEEVFDSPSLIVKSPIFESIQPNRAYAGDTIVIKGENFRSDGNKNHVRFFNPKDNTLTAEVVSSTGTELHVIVPEYAQAGNISVLGYRGPKFNFKNAEIRQLNPDHGVVGDTILITGMGFIPDGSTNIFFNPGVATLNGGGGIEGFTNTSREMKVIVPPGASNGKIRVTYNSGDKEVSILSEAIFQIYPSISALSSMNGPPGSELTIMGHSFTPNRPPTINKISVTINDKVAKVKHFDANKIVVIIPDNATSGPVRITANTRVAIGPVFQVSAAGSPSISSIDPAEARVGEEVIITGVNFSASTQNNIIKFANGKIATVLEASPTILKVTVPEGAETGAITIKVKDSETITGPVFTVKVVIADNPEITNISPISIKQGETLTINGSNFSGDMLVRITAKFSGSVTFDLLPSKTNIAPNQITSVTTVYYDPRDEEPIFPLGDYYVSLFNKSGDEISNRVNLRMAGNRPPQIVSMSRTESFVGDVVDVTIMGTNFDGKETGNIVKFNNTAAEYVATADTDPRTVKVKVPDLPAGSYDVTVTALDQTSAPVQYIVKPEVVVTVPVKSVYYLGVGSSGSIVLNKITPASPTPTLVFTANDEGITSMVVDIANSKVYFSEISNDTEGNNGIFSMNLEGTGKKKIIKTPPFMLDNPYIITDLSLDVANNKLFWPDGNKIPVEIRTGNTNDSPIKDPVLVTKLNAKFNLAGGITYFAGNGKLYFTAQFDDITSGNTYFEILSFNPATPAITPVTLFDQADGMGSIYDLKIDPSVSKIYALTSDENTGNYKIIKANLDGTGIPVVLKEFESNTVVGGISLDLKDSYIYWSQVKNNVGSIICARMDGADISPGVKQQTVYDNLSIAIGSGAGAIAVDEVTGSSAAQRVGMSMNMQLKYRLKKPK